MEPVLELDRLRAYNHTDPTFLLFGRQAVPAVQGVSLAAGRGETVALLGESGSGRSTLLRAVALYQPVESGRILLQGADITRRKREPRIQRLPQDPRAGLALDQPFADAVGRELARNGRAGGDAARERLGRLLEQMGLGPEFLDRAPATCSGGQLQRMALARCLAYDPAVLLLDEPVSGVDPHTAEQVIRVIRAHQARHRTAVLLATHDLRLARRLAHRVAVMLAGRVVEAGPAARVFAGPRHPHTRQLLGLEEERPAPDPDLAAPHPGCPFTGRCPLEEPRCRETAPELLPAGTEWQVACHVPAGQAAPPAASQD